MVMWIGLVLIGLNIIINWQVVKQVVFGPSSAQLLSATATQSPAMSPTPVGTPTLTPSNVVAALWLPRKRGMTSLTLLPFSCLA